MSKPSRIITSLFAGAFILWFVTFIALPAYLWGTNFCFEKRRYVLKQEMCETALKAVPVELRSNNDRCHLQQTNWLPIFASVAYIGELHLSSAPHQFGVGVPFYFDACGRQVRPH